MAAIDLGTFTDSDSDRGVTTRVEVPDAGDLPPVPAAVAERAPAGAVWFGGEYGLGRHRWVGVELAREAYSARFLLLLYAANRSEWVSLVCQSDYSPYGYLYGEHSLSGPYRAGPELMDCVRRAYGARAAAVPAGELERCHPDRLTAAANPAGGSAV
jgi:hypothetical protein